MKMNEVVFRVSLAILLAIGLQFFMVGIFAFRTIDFSGFGVFNWLLEITYLIFAISLSLKDK
jgi:hypothetical protein